MPNNKEYLSQLHRSSTSLKLPKYQLCGVVPLILLSLFTFAFLSPVVASEADATEGNDVKVNLNNLISVSVGISSDVVEIDAKEAGFSSQLSTLTAGTNNASGYSLYIKADDATSDLVSETGGKVPATSIVGTPSDLASNTWGYSISRDPISMESEYAGISTTPTFMLSTRDMSTDTYNLSFGAKTDGSLRPGTYTNHVTVSAIANPYIITSLMELTYMQDMTSEICASTKDSDGNTTITVGKEVTKQLIDKRDGKSYWVAKLADQNCWMTQNLALDLKSTADAYGPATLPLTSDLSNVSSAWSPSSETERSIPTKANADYVASRSWNLGEIVLTNPTGSSNCGDILAGGSITDCEWYKNVASLTPSPDPTNNSAFSATSTVDEATKTYDSHYLIGNYYTWNAATAGTGAETDAENIANGNAALTNPDKLVDATSSICPKGWRLPTSGAYYSGAVSWPYDRDKSFYKLLRAYGYPETGSLANPTVQPSGWGVSSGSPDTSITGDGRKRLDFEPMYFARSGYTYSSAGSLHYAGSNGYLWSSTAEPGNILIATSLYLSISRVYSVNHPYRLNGNAIRCLAK